MHITAYLDRKLVYACFAGPIAVAEADKNAVAHAGANKASKSGNALKQVTNTRARQLPYATGRCIHA
jgi:hypothetical protein